MTPRAAASLYIVDIEAALLPSSIWEIRLTERPVRLASCFSVRPGLVAPAADPGADLAVQARLEVDDEAAIADRLLHDGEHLVGLDRLLQVVEGLVLHRRDGELDGGDAARRDHAEVAVEGANGGQRLPAAGSGRDVEDDELDAVGAELFGGSHRVRQADDAVALPGERPP